MSPKAFTPGPGYPTTDFIHVKRPCEHSGMGYASVGGDGSYEYGCHACGLVLAKGVGYRSGDAWQDEQDKLAIKPSPEAEVEQLRRDRDELAAALAALVTRIDECDAQLCICHSGDQFSAAEALLARIRGAG